MIPLKRFLFLLLTLALLLSACALPSAPEESSAASLPSSSSEPAPAAPEEPLFLKNKTAYGDSGVLWQIPNEAAEALTYPSLYHFGENLLLSAVTTTNDGDSSVELVLLDGTSGESLKALSLPIGNGVSVQVLGTHAAVCNNFTGKITVLDAALNTEKEYLLETDMDAWYLGSDLKTVYQCGYFDGLRVCSAETGEILRTLSAAESSFFLSGSDISLSYLDLDTLKYVYGALELDTGAVISPPFSGNFSYAARSGAFWLACAYADNSVYYYGSTDAPAVLTIDDGTLTLMQDTQQLLHTGYDGTLTLYDTDLSLISRCKLSGLYVSGILWQEALGGYLLLTTDNNNHASLLFWDTSPGMTGEPLPSQSYAEYTAIPAGTAADADLYARAQELSSRYGVEILIADQCDTTFDSFSTEQVTDRDAIENILHLLEWALACYPAGFFDQLAYGHYGRVQIQLVGNLTTINGFGGDQSYLAFAQDNVIVADLFSSGTDTFHHELSHLIDGRLAFDADHRSGALFSEEEWLSLQPEGFSYTYTYDHLPSDAPWNWYSYFIDDYSMTFPTEDRARVFEYASDPESLIFEDAPGLIHKLQYYSDCIRDSFDTTGWPQTANWETPLNAEQ